MFYIKKKRGEIIIETRYYVYEWYDLETNLPFYVGKGTKERMNILQGRSKAFNKYLKNHQCGNRKIYSNLTEDEAYQKEKDIIEKYVQSGIVLTNLDEGGRKLGVFYGKNNPMYGISPQERMDKDTYLEWYKKHKAIVGERNPNYGKHTLKGRKQSQRHIQNRSGSKNGRAKEIILESPQGEEIKRFGCKKDCAQYLIDEGLDFGDLNNIRHRINYAIKKNKLYLGYNFKEI